METRFQTSFIPKKPFTPVGGLNVQTPHHPVASLLMTLSGLVFIVSIVAAGGMYFWKSYLLSAQDTYKTELAEREKQFKPELIEDLKRQNVKIDLARDLLANHLATSMIFDIIGRMTIENVRFSSMDLSVGSNPNDGVKISMRGYGLNLPAIAYQSDVLGQLEKYGLRKVVKNPILSDPTVESDRTVSFGLSAVVDPTSLTYRKSLEVQSGGSASSTDQGL
jgi:hypothetical protein